MRCLWGCAYCGLAALMPPIMNLFSCHAILRGVVCPGDGYHRACRRCYDLTKELQVGVGMGGVLGRCVAELTDAERALFALGRA